MFTFERSPDTEACIVELRRVNNEISYAGLAQAAGLPIGRVKALLPSARRVLLNERIVFGTIRGEGLRRLADTEIVKNSEGDRKRLGRAAGRGLKKLEAIAHYDTLTPREQLTVTTNRTVFALTAAQSRARVPKDVPNAQAAAALVPDLTTLLAGRKPR